MTADQGLIELIRASVIGDDAAFVGPFGPRRVTYADYTASGRSLTFIEDYIRDQVMPLYANTHTEASGTGLQTGHFREDARDVIRRAVGATREEHAVIFCGSGTTGAVDKLVAILNLRIPADLDRRYDLRSRIPADERPVVFIGPFEHHSNELPWRESIADVVTIREDADGHIDLAHLADELARFADRPLRIGSFSAASNVTGILSDTRAISELLHRHGALSFWDFGAAAPYVEIEMSPRRAADRAADGELDTADGELDTKDAVFISPHKLIGGPGTPGLLVVRRDLLTNSVPAVVGGGTVAYVNPFEHVYLSDHEQREEGGTPAIIESIRAGLVFGLKEAVGADAIRDREESFIDRALMAWSDVPNLEILGDRRARRLSIVSFVVRHGPRYLHHNYVVALLNDLFGIQSRGGCSCAGPYGHRLLGIDIETSHAFEREISRGCEGIKPGWVRVNFNYFISETVFGHVIDAVALVAHEGWRLLPHYRFDPRTGLWRHVAGVAAAPLSLHDVRFTPAGLEHPGHLLHEPESRLADYLAEARALLADPPAPPAPPQGLADLAIGAHPDDLVILCGGTLARYAAAGHEVTMVDVTRGDRGSFVHTSEEIARIRAAESIAAAETIGATYRGLGLSDGEVFSQDRAQRMLIVDLVRETRPDVILTHSPNDYMADHNEVSRLVFDASFLATLPLLETGIAPHAVVTPLFQFDTLGGLGFTPTEWVDISATIEQKLDMMRAHASQLTWLRDHDGVDIVEQVRTTAAYRGGQAGVAYAEAFRASDAWLRVRTTRLLP